MVSASRVAAVLLFGAGLVLIADALRRGGASLSIVLIVPVISGSSGEFLLGSLALFAGVVLFFVSLAGPWELVPDEPARSEASSQSGGVVLIGPIPIFFGSARPASRRAVIAWVLLGVALTVVVAVSFAAEFYRF
jgi:uncharacterized protein (TIGR00304 family)